MIIVSLVFCHFNFVIVNDSLGSVIEEVIATRLVPLEWIRFKYVVLVVSIKFDALTMDSVNTDGAFKAFGFNGSYGIATCLKCDAL
ncbi:hypothetical protein IGI04_023261 [Brassica rapa subsp. trilocularis]|uniref:Uncharacterized protein n=1 Tax=Brassica rapa subsp. trilocularis TaxID=1813537 RepID=A0ABQ7M5I4_BRACM|nr:hypothetical protein IGI04_023261 [Brassica rapa subsp. trilocularis]